MHGLADSAIAWVINVPDKAPALVAAMAGYDVWLGNFRGNKYARKHETLDPDKDDEEFWDFSFTEMANHDAIDMIDYIKVETGYNKVGYIGHSMATTVMFYLSAT